MYLMQELTIVDLFHLPYGWMIATQNADLFASDKLPNVARYALQSG